MAAPLPDELIHIIVHSLTVGRCQVLPCSAGGSARQNGASESLARFTTLTVCHREDQFSPPRVLTNPPSLRSVFGPGAAWAPIRDHVKGIWRPYLSKYLEPKTDYGRKISAYMSGPNLGDAA